MNTIYFDTSTNAHWQGCIALVDMMSFFASVEQLDNPLLKGKPVAVTNGDKGSCIITCSYEAREYGIKTGMRLNEALRHCPDLIRCPSRPYRYTEISRQIMTALTDITPDIEVFSVDEAFLDLTGVLQYWGSIEKIADLIRKVVHRSSGGLRCSIGISEGKLTAKYCAKLKKGETTIVPPDKIKAVIGKANIGDICGIGKNIERYLNERGIYKCKDIEKFPMSVLAARFGDIGRRLYLTCLGHDPFAVTTEAKDPKSMGHGKVLPPATTDRKMVYGIMMRLTQRLAERLRRNGFKAVCLSVAHKSEKGWHVSKHKPVNPVDDSKAIWHLVELHLSHWRGEPLYQVHICATDLCHRDHLQCDLFAQTEMTSKIDVIKDQINQKLGRHSVMSATELYVENATMTPVIAFNWNPDGAKQSL